MGGNVIGFNKKTNLQVKAEKIPLKKIGRSEFTKKFTQVFRKINSLFEKEYKKTLWKDENLFSGMMFNGSTSYIFNSSIPDDEIVKYKEYVGDIDIIVPQEYKKELWNLLDKLEGKEIIPGVTYIGCNKPTISSIGEQINSVFIINFGNEKVAAQVDFEFLPVNNGIPSEWAKFSHSSSFLDLKEANLKAVHHKYLIQSLFGGASMRNDIIVVTPSATANNWKSKIKKGKLALDIPRILKFSVGKGVGKAYEPLLDESGNIITSNGKEVWREIPVSKRDYKTNIKEIFQLAFNVPVVNANELKLFNSFVGIIKLIKKYLNQKQIENTFFRYIDKLWGDHAQEIEPDNEEKDYRVKITGYNYFVKQISWLKKYDKKIKNQINNYYKNWKGRRFDKILQKTGIKGNI